MIFVTVGMLHFPFARLLGAIDTLPGDEEIVLQCRAAGERPIRARCVDDLPFDELGAYMRSARVVVSHAGVGSVLTAIQNGCRPIVVPRRVQFGEATDDHQLAFGRRLAQAGIVDIVEDVAELHELLERRQEAAPPVLGGSELVADLQATLDRLIAVHSRYPRLRRRSSTSASASAS